MRSLPRSQGWICGARAAYGGLSSARKYSRVELGAHGICNRRVKRLGERCHQHRDPSSRVSGEAS